MKKCKLATLLLLTLLTVCASNIGAWPAGIATAPEPPTGYLEAIAPGNNPAAYIPGRELTPEEVVEAFFEQHYLSYSANAYLDISGIVDMNEPINRNMTVWTQMLLQRRRLIAEHDLAYVETRRFDYTITFTEEAGDERMAFWKARSQEFQPDERVLHFDITGEKGEAYPPMFAMNTRHTMRLRQVDGVWKITFHYFPGAVRKYYHQSNLAEVSDEVCLMRLLDEFAAPLNATEFPSAPAGAATYSGEQAAEYALAYTEAPNADFYHVGDWMGNCANFTSQSVWYGFAGSKNPSVAAMDNMTGDWFAGAGGGSPAWENVSRFWNYIINGRVLRGQQLSAVSELRLGDVIQTRGAGRDAEDGFSHSLMVVDEDRLLLSQNSPGCFVYYSDLINVEVRAVRPLYLLA